MHFIENKSLSSISNESEKETVSILLNLCYKSINFKMKNISTVLLCLLFSVYSFGQCDYTLKMIDSFDDGWNGNSIDVLVDGSVVLDDVTMASGSEELVTFQVNTGAEVTTIWNGGGSFASDISYEILDNDNNFVVSGNANADVVSGQCIAVCPVISCNYTLNLLDSWGDGWNGNSIDVLVGGVEALDNVTLGNGSQGTETFAVSEGADVTTVWNGGGSFASEVSYEILDTDGTVVGSGNSTTDIISGTITAVCPSCPAPGGLQASANSTTEATLSWTDTGAAAGYEIVVQLAGTGTPTTSGIAITGTTYTATGLSPDTTYEFYILSDCGSASLSNWAGPVDFYTGYCESVPSSNDDQGITQIVLASSTFTSAGDVTYEDFTSPTVDVSQAVETNLQITFATGYTYDTNVWIDFNNDLVYDSATELVFDGVSLSANPTTLNASFTVPNGTASGVYNMRIGTADFGQATPNPCYDGSFGVTVDMTINVTAPPSCIPPTDLAVALNSLDSANVSWTTGGTETAWEYVLQPQGTGAPTAAGTPTSSNPLALTGLNPDTNYEVYLRADCGAGDFSVWTGPVDFYTGYCASVPSSNDDQGITQIVLASSTFTSAGDVTYEDFTSPTVDVSQAVETNLQITFATGYTYDTNVWIDFNNDLVYDSATELVFDGVSLSANPTTLNASFTVPNGTASGVYNMRIGTADFGQATPNPCYDGSFGVTVDMTINVTAPPSCIPPSALTATLDALGSAVTLSWDANNGETQWEYVLQPQGTGVPTAAGTPLAVNPITLYGLDWDTDYEVYLRADCGAGSFSDWTAPALFSTPVQTNFTIDCDAGEVLDLSYCYTNNDTTAWLFTASTAFPVKIVFNSGDLEACCDEITIYDGPDNTGTILFNNDAADIHDLTGLEFQSTATAIYMELDSDGSISCESSTTYSPLDFSVSCATCVTQTVDFSIDGICNPDYEFYVDANISDMGDATSIDLTDNLGIITQTVTSTGVVSLGPYAANQEIIITAVNSNDASCAVESDLLTFICPPPPNECSIVYAGEDSSFCTDNETETTLTAFYHILGQDTTEYEITSVNNCEFPPFVGGTPSSVNIDDRWSEVIDIGFDFCFFGGTYNQLLIGSNGVISFETDVINDGVGFPDEFNGYNLDIGDTLPNASNPTLSEANIFGVGHDINPATGGEINYMILGTSPSRQFVVNYNNVPHYFCNDIISTSQIILYESSNVIDINIIDKPGGCDFNDGLAVVGIQNIDDTIAYTPENRNTDEWEASNESWRFSPSVGTPNYVFEWYDGSTLVGTEETITVSPETTTTYTAAITYNLCTGGTATVTDSVIIEVAQNPVPIAVEEQIALCDGEEQAVLEVYVDDTQQIAEDIVYSWSYNNVVYVSEVSEADGGNILTLGDGEFDLLTGDYIVTAYNTVTDCSSNTVISITSGISPELEDGTSFSKCADGEVDLYVNITNDSNMDNTYVYDWSINGVLVSEGDTAGTFTHGEAYGYDSVTVNVTDVDSNCSSQTTITINPFMNENCVDIPQGISPNGDGLNDCLVLDHLEAQEDIIKAEVYNRYGTKVFELNDYIDQWCGQDASDGNINSNGLLPVGTYFYVIQYASGREPTISWIYLNY